MRNIRSVIALVFLSVLAACGNVNNSNTVILETELGDIEIVVFNKSAPVSSADFLAHVDQGLYDGQGFYRTVRPDNDPLDMGMSLIQGGRLDKEQVLPPIAHETTAISGLSNKPGSVSIARDQPGTGSAAYFFINIGNNDFLDYGGIRNSDGQGYAVFGEVVRGIEVVRAIQMQKTAPSDIETFAGQEIAETVIITKAYRK